MTVIIPVIPYVIATLLQVNPVSTAGEVERLGIVGILALIIIVGGLAFYKGWLYTQGQVKQMREQYDERLKDAIAQRDRLLNLALKTTDIAKEATQEAKRATPARGSGGGRREA